MSSHRFKKIVKGMPRLFQMLNQSVKILVNKVLLTLSLFLPCQPAIFTRSLDVSDPNFLKGQWRNKTSEEVLLNLLIRELP